MAAGVGVAKGVLSIVPGMASKTVQLTKSMIKFGSRSEQTVLNILKVQTSVLQVMFMHDSEQSLGCDL